METMKGRREIGSVISSTYGGNTDSAKVDTKSGSLRSVKFIIGNKLVLFSAELTALFQPSGVSDGTKDVSGELEESVPMTKSVEEIAAHTVNLINSTTGICISNQNVLLGDMLISAHLVDKQAIEWTLDTQCGEADTFGEKKACNLMVATFGKKLYI